MRRFMNAISNVDVVRNHRDRTVVAGIDHLRAGGLRRLRVFTQPALESLRYYSGVKPIQGAVHAHQPSCMAAPGSSGCWRLERHITPPAFATLA